MNSEDRYVISFHRNDEPSGGLMFQRGDGQCSDYDVKWAFEVGLFGGWVSLSCVEHDSERARVPAVYYGFYAGPGGPTFSWGDE